MKTISTVTILLILLSFTNSFALTYLEEDAERGGMWANQLVDASDKFKNTDGSFNSNGGWSDGHNLLGPIPEAQDPYAPNHSSIVTMGVNDWAILSFVDEFGKQLVVNNDSTNPGGYDGIVWGNGFYSGGGPSVWAEPGSVYLSQDGMNWWTLPASISTPVEGTHQTFDLTPGEGDGLVSPGAPWEFTEDGHIETGLAGGDAFDMSTAYFVGDISDSTDDNTALTGLDWFAYIMLSGKAPEGFSQSGPDPDSVYVFSTTSPAPVPVPGSLWLMGLGLTALTGLRRKIS